MKKFGFEYVSDLDRQLSYDDQTFHNDYKPLQHFFIGGFEYVSDKDSQLSYEPVLTKTFIFHDGAYKKLVMGSRDILRQTNVIPIMTSSTSPTGRVSASSNDGANFEEFRAFNGLKGINVGDYWRTPNISGWIMYEFTVPKCIYKYSITPYSTTSTMNPRDWTFEGSNDGINWSILDERSSMTDGGEFLCPNRQAFNMYKLNVASNNGASALAIVELELFEFIPGNYDDSWEQVSTATPSKDNFIKDGISNMHVLNRSEATHDIPMSSQQLSTGKLYRSKVDCNTFFEINALHVKKI